MGCGTSKPPNYLEPGAQPGGSGFLDLEAKWVGPGAAIRYVFGMLQRQEGHKEVHKMEAARYVKQLCAVYEATSLESQALVDRLEGDGSVDGNGLMDMDQWVEAFDSVPVLRGRIEADYDHAEDDDNDRGMLKQFRTIEEQLSKLLGNLDRLRYREQMGENVSAEIDSRRKMVRKMRGNGIVPSPATCVFVQMDIDKSGTISKDELLRLLKSLGSVYPADERELEKVMGTLDTDGSGDVDETEWVRNLAKLPKLQAALQADLDPDTGRLRSFRSPRQQFAKLLGNIERLEYDASRGKEVTEELAQRRVQAQKCRLAGITPSAGIVAFNQLDKRKTRKINMAALGELVATMDLSESGLSTEDVMTKLDTDLDGYINEREWLEGLDRVQAFKIELEKQIDAETGLIKSLITPSKAMFDMLRRQEGAYMVANKEVARYLKALDAVFEPSEARLDSEIARLMKDPGLMNPKNWEDMLASMPKLKKRISADYDAERVRFRTFRSCGQQLSKLLGNLDRLRLRAAKGEQVTAEITSRKKQVTKMRRNGVLPSPGVCVFNQMDLDKSGTVSKHELERLFKALRAVYPEQEGEAAKMMATLDSDGSGEIDEVEWQNNLARLPALKGALQQDLDPDTGLLRSFRTLPQQLAKLLGNIARLTEAQARGEDVADELASRRAKAAKMRASGIVPSAGIVVFNQLDMDKTREVGVEDLRRLLGLLTVTGKTAEEVMARLDQDGDGKVDENEWLEGLDRVQSLKIALEKDIDPDTGKLSVLS